ncbi:MAG: hypothetical protein CVV50_04065 [Spirochaetae bacterium HGW-Spirochaetae-6]|nr:MAG: hypothetical protein CVV50_04065 [Spirochaetae bacterium HGW-Spirochaetae-6]
MFQVSYDRVFFLESFRNLRLGIAISYQAFNATYVDNVEMEVLSYLVSARYMFPLAKDGFLKILTPFISLGLGTSQLRLTKADNSSEGGMNSTIQGGLGLDIFINYNVDLNLEANYKLIMGQGEYALSILQLLAGVSWKF